MIIDCWSSSQKRHNHLEEAKRKIHFSRVDTALLLWSKPPSLHGKAMRFGGMDITMAYLASIGKLYGDGGLLSILIKSEMYGENSTWQMLQGKQLSRVVRSMKLIQEALFWLFCKAMDRTTRAETINLKVGTTEGCSTFIPCQGQGFSETIHERNWKTRNLWRGHKTCLNLKKNLYIYCNSKILFSWRYIADVGRYWYHINLFWQILAQHLECHCAFIWNYIRAL